MSHAFIDSSRLDQWLADGAELGALDLRTQQEFGKWASRLPAILRRNGRAVELAALGNSDLHVLTGGFPAWVALGSPRAFSITGTRYSQTIETDFNTPAEPGSL